MIELFDVVVLDDGTCDFKCFAYDSRLASPEFSGRFKLGTYEAISKSEGADPMYFEMALRAINRRFWLNIEIPSKFAYVTC